jgi:hypothetical protein
MKIKFLLLLFITAGIIMISGCIDMEKQPLTLKAPGGLYRSIFYPNVGLQDHRNFSMPDDHPSDLFPPQSGTESITDINNATSVLDNNIQKADIASKRLENVIQRQKAEGKNVSDVEALLKKYKLLVAEANKNRALADNDTAAQNNISIDESTIEDNSSENLRKEYLIKTQDCMIQANEVMKEIFAGLQRLMPGSIELNSTSHLRATGDGIVNIMGNLTLNLHIESGEMGVPSISQDSKLNIKGDYTFDQNSDMQGRMSLYRINSADVTINGSRKAVMLRGKNITLTADGDGVVTFQGNGTYSIEDAGGLKTEQKWARPFYEEGTIPDQGPGGPGKYDPDS